jgi:LmbE family N-acetylglucosaminyl deacetylase
MQLQAGTTIEVSASEDIHALYIIWALPPGEWSVEGSVTEYFGANDFIHEYVPLQYPANNLTINIPANGTTISDIYAFTEGYPPDWVQVWEPPLEKADMLVLPTHSDDEHLFFVGILPYYAGEKGFDVQVAYLINHWHQPPRPHELLNGLWVVGIRNYPVIGNFRDRYSDSLESARSMYGWDNVVGFQTELLRRFKPSVVVGHDLRGEYGHGAHMLNAHSILAAVQSAGNSSFHTESYEKYGVWDTPKLYLHLYRENFITKDWSIPLEHFGGATGYELAVAGYSKHRSQHRWSFRVPESGPMGHRFGLAFTLVGEDIISECMFENIQIQTNRQIMRPRETADS